MSTEQFLPFVPEAQILSYFSAQSARRGKIYAQRGAVSDLQWMPEGDGRGHIAATVVGGDIYHTLVGAQLNGMQASGIGLQYWMPTRAHCTCPVDEQCKHAAAVIYAANTAAMARQLGSRSRGRANSSWRDALSDLLTTPEAATNQTPLAIGVDLLSQASRWGFTHYGSASARRADVLRGATVTVGLRPLRRGSSGRWIRGGLLWRHFRHNMWQHPAAQAEFMQRLVRQFLADDPRNYDPADLIRLNDFRSPDGWQILAAAAEAGVELVGMGAVDQVRWTAPAKARLDVRAVDDGLELQAVADVADVEEARLSPCGAGGFLRVLEDDGACVVQLTPAQETICAPVLRMLENASAITIPAEDTDEFRGDVAPQLSRVVEVSSSDNSVDLPTHVPPQLVMQVTHGADVDDDITVDVSWWWRYRAPTRRIPLRCGSPDGHDRDLATEDAVWAQVQAAWPAVAEPDSERLTEAMAAQFIDHVLPAVEAIDGVDVVELGKRPACTELTGIAHLRVTQSDAASRDWLDLGFEIRLGRHVLPFAAVFAALARGKKAVMLGDGNYAKLTDPRFDRLRELITEAEAMAEWEPETPRIGRYHVSLWEDFEDLADESLAATSWRESVGRLASVTQMPRPEVPAGLRAQLRPYQYDGYAWLSFLYDHHLGGILADDMGLGKTIQTLALIARAREQDPDAAPFLVVAPSSVVTVWSSEAARFTPDVDVRILQETSAKRSATIADDVAGADVVVTSYTLLRLDAEEFTAQPWSGLILDEAQFVKNRASKAHQTAAWVQAPFTVAITGTPMENSLTDLWSLLSLTAPGLFPSPRQFRADYVKPIEKPNPQGLDESAERMARLRRRVRPFMLRRTKEIVATELPEKQVQVTRVQLTAAHRRLYDKVLQRERQKLLGLLTDLDRNRFIVFRSLTLLRMLALDPAIVDEADAHIPSAKLTALLESLDEIIAEGHRVLVFSQFTSYLGRIAEQLRERGVPFAYLDGSTRNRSEVIANFRAGETPVFLISLKAGGFGLTLTEADYVFVMDPWWNPAAEVQAVDRTHRIGQTRRVMVYRMVAENTIEEKVLALQERKAALFASLTDGESAFSAAITADDVRELLDAGT